MACANALVAVRAGRRYVWNLTVGDGALQPGHRLEVPLIAVLVESQRHHAPVVAGSVFEIVLVEVDVPRRIFRSFARCARRYNWVERFAAGANDEFADTFARIIVARRIERAVA